MVVPSTKIASYYFGRSLQWNKALTLCGRISIFRDPNGGFTTVAKLFLLQVGWRKIHDLISLRHLVSGAEQAHILQQLIIRILCNFIGIINTPLGDVQRAGVGVRDSANKVPDTIKVEIFVFRRLSLISSAQG